MGLNKNRRKNNQSMTWIWNKKNIDFPLFSLGSPKPSLRILCTYTFFFFLFSSGLAISLVSFLKIIFQVLFFYYAFFRILNSFDWKWSKLNLTNIFKVQNIIKNLRVKSIKKYALFQESIFLFSLLFVI